MAIIPARDRATPQGPTMLELAEALAKPLAVLLLKSYLGDATAEVAGNLYELAKKHFAGQQGRAAEAQARARGLARAVLADLEGYFGSERAGEGELDAAAHELGLTLERHVSPAFLVGRDLDAAAVERALLDARPPEQAFPGEEAPVEAYRRLIAALAPRLRAVAPETAGYAVERDAALLQRLAALEGAAAKARELLAGMARREAEASRDEEERRREYGRLYRSALRAKVGKLKLFGLHREQATPTHLPLDIAYIPLRLGLREAEGLPPLPLDYPELLTLLPLFGNRLLIEGAAGLGKTTLLQWAALAALDAQEGRGRQPPDLGRALERLAGWCRQVPEEARLALGLPPPTGLAARRGADGGTFGPTLRPLAKSPPWWGRTLLFVRLRLCPEGCPPPEELPALIAREAGRPPQRWVVV